jgi:subtilisin family serine protease
MLLIVPLPPPCRADSWGSTSPIYDFQASKLDSWLYNNQDCISHFAAGNYGENDNLDSTITSPATSKNAVTVGATKTATPNYVSQTIAPVFTLSVEIRRPSKPSQFLGVRLVKAGGCACCRQWACVAGTAGARAGLTLVPSPDLLHPPLPAACLRASLDLARLWW